MSGTQEDPCELWTGVVLANGYGQLTVSGQRWSAHRWVWTQANGPIPAGMQVLHHCDNPTCVKLTHLHLGTQADNMREKVTRGRDGYTTRTHCPQGHPYDEENTYWRKDRPGQRQCRACARELDKNRESGWARSRRKEQEG
jgi:hypothetical protein